MAFANNKGDKMYQGNFYIQDSSLDIWVEPEISGPLGREWENNFIQDVMNPIKDILSELNFALQPQKYIFDYPQNKYGRKGDLRLDLLQSGRKIELNFFQDVNAPNRPDNAGRHEWDKMKLMPYLMQKEVLRVFKRVVQFLNEKTQITLKKNRNNRSRYWLSLGKITAYQWVELNAGEHDSGLAYEYNCTSADQQKLSSGDRVYFYDYKGRIRTGIARYNINNMWWVITGKYDFINEGSHDLYKTCPGDVRIKNNQGARKRALSKKQFDCEMQGNLRRAAQIKGILDREFGDFGLIVSRDQARDYFKHCGLSLKHITRYQFDQLRKLVNEKMIASKLFKESYQVNRKTKFNGTTAYIGCKAHYFKDREAIQFNGDGFIGFAGWAGDAAVKPILEAFIEWCNYVKTQTKRRAIS